MAGFAAGGGGGRGRYVLCTQQVKDPVNPIKKEPPPPGGDKRRKQENSSQQKVQYCVASQYCSSAHPSSQDFSPRPHDIVYRYRYTVLYDDDVYRVRRSGLLSKSSNPHQITTLQPISYEFHILK